MEARSDTTLEVLDAILEVGSKLFTLMMLLLEVVAGILWQLGTELDGERGRRTHLVRSALLTVPVVNVVLSLALLDDNIRVSGVELAVTFLGLQSRSEVLNAINLKLVLTATGKESFSVSSELRGMSLKFFRLNPLRQVHFSDVHFD